MLSHRERERGAIHPVILFMAKNYLGTKKHRHPRPLQNQETEAHLCTQHQTLPGNEVFEIAFASTFQHI